MRKAIPPKRCGWPIVPGFVLIFLFNSIAFPGAASGQVIENPAKPKAANAGRVVTPQEVLAISDEGTGDFYFKWPRELRAAPGGSLLLTDEDQVLEFDAKGRFVRNLFKKGQGPGEIPWLGSPVAAGKNIVVYSPAPAKLIFFGPAGTYEREVAVRDVRSDLTLIGCLGDRFYFESGEFPKTAGDPDVVDNPRTIVAMNVSDGTIKMLSTFVTRAWVVTSPGGGGGMFPVTSLIAVPFDDNRLALTHTEEYLIKLFDPAANAVVREFRRPYERVKGLPLTEAQKKGGILIGNKHYTRPERKFENDVKNILVRNAEIWAVTSTEDRTKGVLIDVFDGEGAYRDCFWLKLPERALASIVLPGQSALDGEFLWVVERAEDETYSIKKYRAVI